VAQAGCHFLEGASVRRIWLKAVGPRSSQFGMYHAVGPSIPPPFGLAVLWKYGIYCGLGLIPTTLPNQFANMELGTTGLTARVDNPLTNEQPSDRTTLRWA
jgi:hypothetical protein